MTIQAGDKMPQGQFTVMGANGPEPLSTDELFKDKKVVLFAVPGAFTPTCSQQHLPGFVQQADALKAKGVDTVACMAVNDVFVMAAWGQSANVGDKLVLLADGNADYTRALGLGLDASGLGMGLRAKRFFIVVENGVAKEISIEENPTACDVSSAQSAVAKLS